MDLLDNGANKAIAANKANEANNEAHGVLDNQLAELEKLDVANKASASNRAGEADANNATEGNKANDDIEKVCKIYKANANNEAVASGVAIETNAVEKVVKADDN
jgi:hypothetical protein